MRHEASKKALIQRFGLPLFRKVDHRVNSSATSNRSPGDPYLAHSFDLVAVRNVAFPTASAMAAKRRFETSLKRLKCLNSGHSHGMPAAPGRQRPGIRRSSAAGDLIRWSANHIRIVDADPVLG